VPGLRRSEVAVLAGISTEYYIKLEQGQEVKPTDQVLDSLSRALKLDATATSYLHSLVRPADPRTSPPSSPTVEHTRWLINSWPMTAAMILGRFNDIIAANSLMTTLIPGFQPGRNALVAQLMDPEMRELYIEWEGLSSRSIGLMRSQVAVDPSRVRGQQLIAQLTRDSQRFRELWQRHDIVAMSEGTHPMNHPVVGELSLHYAHLPLMGTDGHSVFLYYAEPGTPSERALAALAAGR
jgi:transcriptional regulator with XRE-family HTH domain